MVHTYFRLYKKYYCITIGRFYTKEQRQKLLLLLAAGCGITPEGDVFRKIQKSIEAVDAQHIRDLVEGKNYCLMCSLMEEDDDIVSAASALVSCYEERLRSGEKQYASPIEWRVSLYSAAPKTQEIKMELAYIEYVADNISEAVGLLKQLADAGNLTAVEHLAVICSEHRDCEKALYYTALYDGVCTKKLRLEPQEWVRNLRERMSEGLSEPQRTEIEREAEKKSEILLGQINSRPMIGF